MRPPEERAITSSQQPWSRARSESAGAGVLLLILLFVCLPAWKALLAIGLIFGIALPFVLIERRMVFAYNAERPTWPWELLAYVLAAAAAVALFFVHLWRMGVWP